MRSYRPRRYRSHRPMRLGLWLPITVPYKYAGHRHRPCSNRLISPPRRAYSSKPSARCCSGRQLLGQTDRWTDTVPLLNRAAYYASIVNVSKRLNAIWRLPVSSLYSPVQPSSPDSGDITRINFWLYYRHICISRYHSARRAYER